MIVMVSAGCSSPSSKYAKEQKRVEKIHSTYKTGEIELNLEEFMKMNLTYYQAQRAIRIANPAYGECMNTKVRNASDRMVKEARCKCQIRYLPKDLWSDAAIKYHIRYLEDKVNEYANL